MASMILICACLGMIESTVIFFASTRWQGDLNPIPSFVPSTLYGHSSVVAHRVPRLLYYALIATGAGLH